MDEHVDVLVEPAWVASHLDDPSVRVVEVDEDGGLYARAHIPGAIGLDWRRDLQARASCSFLGPEQFGALLGERGISNRHTIVLYGDRDNWFAATTLWYLKYYGHHDVRLLEHGRDGWIDAGLPVSRDVPRYGAERFTAGAGDPRFSAAFDDGSHSGWGGFGEAVLDPAEI